MEASDNQKYIEGLLRGDEATFKLVFDTYYRLMVITSYQILKDENVCKDAVQEVFFELWKKREKLHHGIRLQPYLKRSVMNRSLNILKSRKHHMSSGEAPLAYLKDHSRQPDEVYDDMELKNVVMAAIDSMPDRCRAVFMMRRIDGMTHNEIAQKLDISTKTIENQMTKALKIIRSAITKYQGHLSTVIISIVMGWGKTIFELFIKYHHHL